MRTTVTLAPEVAAAVRQLKATSGMGTSEAINLLVLRGLAAGDDQPAVYEDLSYDIGVSIDVSNVAEALDLLDEWDRRGVQ